MFWRDHAPPHFHAKHGNDEIIVEIESGLITGSMSKRALAMVLECRDLHRNELLGNWKLAEQKKALKSIDPLE